MRLGAVVTMGRARRVVVRARVVAATGVARAAGVRVAATWAEAREATKEEGRW